MGRAHEVVLLGKKFKLRSTLNDEYLADLASYVTAQVGEAQRRGGTVSTLDAALLAALNIADEYHRLKRDMEERLAAIGEKTQALLTVLEEEGAENSAAPVVDVDDPADLPKADLGR